MGILAGKNLPIKSSHAQKWPLGVFLATEFETLNVNILG
jgi:hypothetical protein